MPLSDNEQRLLEQMERALSAEDPKFASAMRGASKRAGSYTRLAIGVAAILIGLVVLLPASPTARSSSACSDSWPCCRYCLCRGVPATTRADRRGRQRRHRASGRSRGRAAAIAARPGKPVKGWQVQEQLHAAHGAAVGPPQRRAIGRFLAKVAPGKGR